MTLAQMLIVVLDLWTVLLCVDGCATAMNRRQRFRTTRIGLYVILVLYFLIYAVTIYRLATSFAPPNWDRAPSETTHLVDEISQVESVFLQVAEGEADAVMIVELSIPGVAEKAEHRFPLQRNPQGESDFGSYSSIAVDGRTKEGRGMGYGGSFRMGGPPEELQLGLSLYWTARDGSQGHLEEELQVPWLGQLRKELNSGVLVEVRFLARDQRDE